MKPLYWCGLKMNGMVSMTREDIVRMAKEAGMESFDICVELDDFAKLVAQHEHEAILAVIGDNQCECRCSEVVRDRGKV